MGAQARALNSDLIDPFIRWAGAKRRQRQALLQLSPANFGRYFEPFLGSGALFFALKPRRAVLNDRILPLIETWRSVASHPRQVAEAASSWPVDRETYYQIRALEPEDPIIAAARFIYLNKTCFNGLYRVNAQGKFNVPYGRPKSSYITTLDELERCASALRKHVTLSCGDFESSANSAGAGDFVYFDPPYVTGHSDNGFVEYNEVLFNWQDQQRLAQLARELSLRGVHVLVSNAHHDAVLELYQGFRATTVTVHSSMASSKTRRTRVSEVIIHNHPSGELIS